MLVKEVLAFRDFPFLPELGVYWAPVSIWRLD